MFEFIYVLKCIAAMFITNAHYADIWPVSKMAFGGHIGNCLYFFCSGFCLYKVKDSFHKWYLKRIIRIYPALWIAASIDFLIGRNNSDTLIGYIHCYLFPTWYHFVTAIMIHYVVFYIIIWMEKRYAFDIRWWFALFVFIFLTSYCLCFDRNYFHIENIDEIWEYFQFIECMLIGAWFRKNYESRSKVAGHSTWLLLVLFFLSYIAGKVLIPRYEGLYSLQVILPFILIAFTYYTGICIISLEKKKCLAEIPDLIKKIIYFIAGISLEIYLGQYCIIATFNRGGFPVNLFIVTGLILFYAWMIHKAAGYVQHILEVLLKKVI